jgi:hypothetical protein
MIKTFAIICASIALTLNIIMSDANNIYKLYAENTANQEPVMRERQGNKVWYLHGELHRVGAPAIEWENGAKFWYQHDKLHREDGPAAEYADGEKMWFLRGKKYDDASAWAKALLKMHNKPHDADAIERFLRDLFTREDLI